MDYNRRLCGKHKFKWKAFSPEKPAIFQGHYLELGSFPPKQPLCHIKRSVISHLQVATASAPLNPREVVAESSTMGTAIT